MSREQVARNARGSRAPAPGPFAEPAESPTGAPAGNDRRVILLGPQRLQPTLDAAVASLGVRGPIAAVTAGWEEREGEDQELAAHLAHRTFNLRIWERGEDVYRKDGELHGAVRERNERLGVMQDLYRLRLAHMLEAAREIMRRKVAPGLEALYAEELDGALANVRALDREHLARIRALHVEFQERWTPWLRPAVAEHRAALARELERAELLCVAGGHVAVLLRRMRLFGVLELCQQLPIIAWSAGAMVVSERIVLFHDLPPQAPGRNDPSPGGGDDPSQGAGSAEVYDVGLGACRGVVPLPHAHERLVLDDPRRVALFARRFAPDLCVALVPRAELRWEQGRWHGASGTMRLDKSGELAAVRA